MYIKFSERLKELRTGKNLTQQQLADSVRMKRYNISDWEQGRTEPDISSIITLADFFTVTTDYLLGKE